MTFKVQVTDKRGKYPPKVYSVTADSELMAYAEATEKFIIDNNHPKRKVGQRLSVYFARFWNQVIK